MKTLQLGMLARVLAAVLLAFSLVAGSLTLAGPAGSSPGAPEAHGASDRRPSEAAYDALADRAHRDGAVRAVVSLSVAFEAEGQMNAQARSAQRSDIARQRRAMYRGLEGTEHREIRAYGSLPLAAVELSEAAVERLRRSKRVADVKIDELRRPALAESALLIEADLMWDIGLDGGGHMVAILDTGVDTSHPFFGGRVVEEACYSTRYAPHGASSVCPGGVTSATGPGTGVHCDLAVTSCGHGTHVAGIAAGSGSTFDGIARGAEIMSVQVFSRIDDADACSPSASPCAMAYISDTIAGLERVFAVSDSYDIAAANMSLGGGHTNSTCDAEPEKPAIDQLRSANIATVISSGNGDSSDGVSYPACISTAVAVGSTTKADAVSSFSNTHPSLVDLLAPGSSIRSSVAGGGFQWWSGTSMAAPHVTGAWALLRDRFQSWSVDKVLEELKTGGLAVTDSRPGGGFALPRIRVHQVSTAALHPSCGQIVTGDVVLAADLECEGDGIVVGAAGANIDLNGFVMRGQGSGRGVRSPDASEVTVRGGTIRRFGNGVWVDATKVVLEDLRLVANVGRGARIVADETVVSRVVASGNGLDGLLISGGRVDVVEGTAKKNGRNGFRLETSRVAVLDSILRANRYHGVIARSDRTLFKDNRVRGNGGHGLVSGAKFSSAYRNVALYNARLGIALPNVSTVKGSANDARYNNDGGRQCRPPRIC